MRIGLTFICLLVLAAPAWASPPCECEVAWSYPANGAIAVPTNVQLLVWSPRLDRDSLELATDTDPPEPVAATVGPAGDRAYQYRVVPDGPLAGQTEYTLKADLAGGGSFGIAFTTGDGPDDNAPTLAGASVTGGSLSGACRSHLAAVVSVLGGADDLTPAEALLAEVELVDPEAGPGAMTILLPAGQRVMGDSSDGCLTNAPGVEPERPYQARVRLVDWSGNASEFTDPVTFTFRQNGGSGGCGCGPAFPAGPAAWVALGLMFLAWLRARGE